MINARPVVARVPLGTHPQTGAAEQHAVVLDDFLLDPAAMVDLAERHRDGFASGLRNAFPGPELPVSASVMSAWTECLMLHARDALGLRRVRSAYGRLSIVALQPQELAPMQRLCHRDRLDTTSAEVPIASVVYLFADPALGGTRFYRPRLSLADVDRTMREVAADGHARLDALLGAQRCYMCEGNAWFEPAAAIEPRWNRAVFYRGDLFHTSHITDPARLTPDPRRGRLTMNGFFIGRPRAG